jgi:Transcription termination factor nusG
VGYWCAARLQPGHERYALHCLQALGYSIYRPRIRERRIVNGRKIEVTPALFPGYCFVTIELQWNTAR